MLGQTVQLQAIFYTSDKKNKGKLPCPRMSTLENTSGKISTLTKTREIQLSLKE
jgi:hypothetical protein